MCKIFNIVVFVLAINGINYGQVDTINSIQELNVLGGSLSDEFELDIDYIKEKETLYLTVIKDSTIVSGFLVKDIHPEGIFIIESEVDKQIVRILSMDNGHKFVHENFRNGFRLSNNTNYIDIEGFNDMKKSQSFVYLLKEFIASKTEKPKSNTEIEVYLPKTKN